MYVIVDRKDLKFKFPQLPYKSLEGTNMFEFIKADPTDSKFRYVKIYYKHFEEDGVTRIMRYSETEKDYYETEDVN